MDSCVHRLCFCKSVAHKPNVSNTKSVWSSKPLGLFSPFSRLIWGFGLQTARGLFFRSGKPQLRLHEIQAPQSLLQSQGPIRALELHAQLSAADEDVCPSSPHNPASACHSKASQGLLSPDHADKTALRAVGRRGRLPLRDGATSVHPFIHSSVQPSHAQPGEAVVRVQVAADVLRQVGAFLFRPGNEAGEGIAQAEVREQRWVVHELHEFHELGWGVEVVGWWAKCNQRGDNQIRT